MRLDPLLLFSGNDIPFTSSGVTIHHPTIKEIAYLGEDTFFTGYQMLIISKNILSQEDKVNLEGLTNFDIIMSIMTEKEDPKVRQQQVCVQMLFAMIFPEYKATFTKQGIVLVQEGDNQMHIIHKDNFDAFSMHF